MSSLATERSVRTVPFVDLQRLHQGMDGALERAFQTVVDEGAFTLGKRVEMFEDSFARYTGVDQSIGVGSGTDALHFALRACGVGPGDEVITAVNTFAATAEAIVMAGARPVFVDVDESTLLMTPEAVEHAITERTRAIVPVHLYGQPVDMDGIMALARPRGIKVVEDACQAHGATCRGRRAGRLGDAGCFSFYPSKNLGALGDGGIVTTDDPEIADRVRSLRNHGEDDRRLHVESAYCSRLHGVQAALLSEKLPLLDGWNAGRMEAAASYDELLGETGIVLPGRADGMSHVFHLYVVRVKERDRVRELLGERGIQTAVHYAVPLHLEPAFESLGYKRGTFPVAEEAAMSMVSLPMHPHIDADEVAAVANAVAEVAHG